ncbi:MAG TPA: GDP-mannose 4,6-dehydratase [Chitinophagaceae bacterium]|nr:GDP-mannose 4,6-dehydratase [Chitinophagaceae bacterium]
MNKTALITGITGQDGAYLSKHLLEQGYKVTGIVRSYFHSSLFGLEYLGIAGQVDLKECDLSDLAQVIGIIKETRPDEIYNLAAQSSVSLSFKQPIGTISFNIISVLNLLEAIKLVKPDAKFYQASSSEIFGTSNNLPLTEDSKIHPVSPYAISKESGYWITRNYREAYNLFACSGFLFNHESFLRSENFFVKKVIRQSVAISRSRASTLQVGNIDIKRDFGWAPEYVKAMHLILSQAQPDDFIICSGRSVSLRSIIEYVFDRLHISVSCLETDASLQRPTEITDIYGDSTKARELLGWHYDRSFYEVLDILIEEEIAYNGR